MKKHHLCPLWINITRTYFNVVNSECLLVHCKAQQNFTILAPKQNLGNTEEFLSKQTTSCCLFGNRPPCRGGRGVPSSLCNKKVTGFGVLSPHVHGKYMVKHTQRFDEGSIFPSSHCGAWLWHSLCVGPCSPRRKQA